ncbi:MAG TPA: hypothetical protein VEB43_03920 [Anaeromyxobacter sp.]|nr:hypothetical protein [Anaeromyxobacter sp.]
MLDEALRLADHHPKVVKGDQLPGLDPASYFVVLGICRRDQLDVPYQILKELYPRVSERPVVAPQADDCPRRTEGARPLGARSLSSADRRLTVTTYVKDPGTQGTSPDPNPGTLAVIAALFDAKGRYLDSQVLGCVNSSDYPGEPRCRFELKPAQDRIVVTRDYECTTGEGCIDEYLRLVEEVTFRIGKGNKVEMRKRVVASKLTEAE